MYPYEFKSGPKNSNLNFKILTAYAFCLTGVPGAKFHMQSQIQKKLNIKLNLEKLALWKNFVSVSVKAYFPIMNIEY